MDIGRTVDGVVDDALITGNEYLYLGVSWVPGVPTLDLVEVCSVRHVRVPVVGRRVAFRTAAPDRFCTGRYGFADRTGIDYLPCPRQERADQSAQCARCAGLDEFRFAHNFHQGGYAPPALTEYMNQPHWVYVATFADALSKVGTATDARRRSRIDEQGAVTASYVAHTRDGRTARILEDTVTRELAVTQYRRRTEKVAALAAPAARETIDAAHRRVTERVLVLLAGVGKDGSAAVGIERWHPPAEARMVLDPTRARGWQPYQHDLRSGGHGFVVDACAGPALLVRTSPEPDAQRYVLDMGRVKGRRIVAGAFVSPESVVQDTLF
ncbi:MAG: hypothetical protein AUG49_05385 [Catenulispora sp. 13_1_20CM_3_70_7]|nr:MAG: hypothetical protein AUG49_05385 [Catenulispora sp. 13_1_20CM_3_70_7]